MARTKPRETDRGPSASWSIGKEVVGTDRMYKGWFVDRGLNESLDEAAKTAGWASGKMTNLDNVTNQFWFLPNPAHLYVLIDCVPYTTVQLLTYNNVAYSGLRCFWGEKGSSLAFQALHPDLLKAGYETPIIFQAGSYRTEEILAALLAHNDVLDACERAAAAAGNARAMDFWDVSLPFVPGEKITRSSKTKEGASSNVVPPTSGHPPIKDITTEYLRSLWAPSLVRKIRQERWDEIVAWADTTEWKAKHAAGRDAA